MSEISLIIKKIKIEKVDFDEERLTQLYNDTGPETVFKIMAHFHETLSSGSILIEKSIATQTLDNIKKIAHKISGSSELLGFVKLGQQAKQLNQLINENPQLSASDIKILTFLQEVQKIQKSIIQVLPDIRAYLS